MTEHSIALAPSSQPDAIAPDSLLRVDALSRLRRLRLLRPDVSQEGLLLLVSLYFVVVCSLPFWKALLADRTGPSWGLLGYVVAVGSSLVALHFVLLGLIVNRWTAKPVIGLLIFVAASTSFFMNTYGIYLDQSMLRNVLSTDAAEARELFTPALLAHLLLYALLPLAVLQRLRLRRRKPLPALVLRTSLMLLALLVSVGALSTVFKDFAAQMRNHKEIRNLITPASAVYSFGRVLSREAKAADRPRTPIGTDARLGASWQRNDKPVLFVIVVGETARAANWGLNGGGARDTTPELAQRNVINFSDVQSCGTNTEVSVPCLFSVQGRHNYDEDAIRGSESLLHVLQHAGLRVLWDDNQSGCKGVCDGVEATRPDPKALPELCDGERCLDEALVLGTEQQLRSHRGSQVLVLHQLGNHGPAYFKRYPPEFRRFTPTCDSEDFSRCSREEIANSYDNALLYTDHVLARLIDLLQASTRDYDTALLYVSDHGESLGEKGLFLHGMPYAIAPHEQTRVPMLMWFSSGYAQRFGLDQACLHHKGDQSVSHDNVFHTVLGLLEVSTAVRDQKLDLAASCRS